MSHKGAQLHGARWYLFTARLCSASDSLKTLPPHTLEGIVKYLGSGLIKGIGPHFAKKIVQTFGERTLGIIDESPSYLKEIKGIGPRRIQRIRESWQEQKAVRHIMLFLQSNGIGTARAVRIYKTYGDQAVDIIRANPYRLAAAFAAALRAVASGRPASVAIIICRTRNGASGRS